MSFGHSAALLKSGHLKQYGIPARMFDGLRVSLEGNIFSVKEQLLQRRDELLRRIGRAQNQIGRVGVEAQRGWVHQKERRLTNLVVRLKKLELDIECGRVRLGFGAKRPW